LRVDATKLDSLAIRQVVHCRLCDVESVVGVVHGEDIYCLAVVSDTVASAALRLRQRLKIEDKCMFTNLGTVPARNTHVSTDAREAGHLALSGPTVLGDQAV
jgi:hypothetical protein